MNKNADPNNATPGDFEALFVNNRELDRISAYLNRFNPIRVMRMQSMEIRHSAILAWLLDPTENHGFDDEFLRAFLAQALVGSKNAKLSALDVSQADLRDAEIQREKRDMDIFVISPSQGWAFVIENKFHSKQSDGQLSKYLERAKKDAMDAGKAFTHQGIFLTLHDEAPNDDAADQYVALKYSEICEILSSVMTAREGRMGGEVRQFLEHYLDVIREATDMSDDQKVMANIARQLYRTHKKALDFIMEHGVSTEFMVAAEIVFGENLEYGDKLPVHGLDASVMYHSQNQRIFSFLPTTWLDALGDETSKPWIGCENWWAGFPVICWLQLNTKPDGVQGGLFLYAEVGPLADAEARTDLIESIKHCAQGRTKDRIKFRADATKPGAKYSKFFNRNNTTIEDISDAEAIAKGMKKLIKEFNPVFDNVANSLKEYSSRRGDQDG
ncbi:MAG: PD-(D/E)XK nuclease family protein [Marivita sp.]|jgi:hypothetical protein|uniref:PDDEXK-like family protein n=1 Tax=Marivita sp. TaxID=2003365 RepID=UPI001B0ADED7|nr:PD-(D/E)XK nuclease family protein [Marivita sp.]MBO6882655.1 PD-(D/E)XK nuclease family protein [Marivita sp.]